MLSSDSRQQLPQGGIGCGKQWRTASLLSDVVDVGVRVDEEVGKAHTRRSRPAAAHKVCQDDLVGSSIADGRCVRPCTTKQIQEKSLSTSLDGVQLK